MNEGSNATFTLSSTNVAAGTQVAYTLSGVSAADVQGGALTGTATVGANGQATISVALLADALTEGVEFLRVTAAGKTASTIVNDTSTGPTYSIAPSSTSVNEGSNATFILSTTNVAAGTQVAYSLSGISAADVQGGSLTGTTTVGSNGQATISVGLLADSLTEGVETLTVTAAGRTATTSVNDTSIGVPTYSLSASAASVNEGSNAVFILRTTNVNAGTQVAYTLSGVSAVDVQGGALTGTATVGSNGQAMISVGLIADKLTEGAETITITAAGRSASTIVNDISVSDDYASNINTIGRITIGGSNMGRIETSGDKDWFAVSLTAGTTYSFRLDLASSGGLNDPYLTLYNSAGQLISSNDDGGGGVSSLISFTAAASSIYYLEARDFSSGSGGYILSAALGAPTYSIAPASTSVNEGSTATFILSTTNVAAGTQVAYSLSGISAADVQGGSLTGTTTVGSNGQATISVGLLADSLTEGVETLTVTAAGRTATTSVNDTSIGVPTYSLSASAASVNEGSNAVFILRTTNVNAGTQVAYTLSGVSAVDVQGGALTGTATVGSNGQAMISVGLIADKLTEGAETITITAAGRSASTIVNDISVSDDYASNINTIGRITIGGSNMGRIETSGDKDWFAVSLTAGTTYSFRLDLASSGGLNDPYLTLYNSAGQLISSNDDGGGGVSSLISFTAAASSIYYLEARDFSSGSGGYILSAAAAVLDDYTSNISTAGRVTIGSSNTGRIETSGDKDWFAVSLTAGTTYSFSLNPAPSSGLNDPYLTLYNNTGQLLSSNDNGGGGVNSMISFTASASGTYYLEAKGVEAFIGNYVLSTSQVTTAAPSSGYAITVNYSGDSAYNMYFMQAAARWSEIITEDLPDFSSAQYGLIDDLLIEAQVKVIDGRGSILGQAGPDGFRSGSGLPYHGRMIFDVADMQYMESQGILLSVILHEMGHVLGIGTLWSNMNLRSGFNYVGENAVAAYRLIAGNNSLISVPLEQNGGSGTAGSHWSEFTFDRELMTGYSENSGLMPISIMTIGSLADLGYKVSYNSADLFSI